MFCIESKIVHVGAGKIIMFYVKFKDFCFTSNDEGDYAIGVKF